MGRRRRTRGTYGDGSVYEKRPGAWVIAWRENGKRRVSRPYPTEAQARAVKRQLAAGLAAERIGKRAAGPTLGFHGDAWIERRKLTHKAWIDDRSRWTLHVRPALGHLLPHQVDAAAIRAMVEAKLAAGLAPETVGHLVRLLSTMYADFLERPKETGVTVNPVRSLTRATRRLYRSTHRPEDTPYLKLPDVERVARELPEPFRSMVLTGCLAMLRTGEVLGLHAEDIDLDRGVILVRRQVRGGKLRGLKDRESRTVPLQDALRPVLQAASLAVGHRGPLWPTRHKGGGRPGAPPKWIRPQTLHKALRAALAKVTPPVDRVTWYQITRHSGASAWVLAGGDMARLALILGHSSTEVTRRYAHLRPDAFTDQDRARMPLNSYQIDSPEPLAPVVQMRKPE